MSEEQEQPQQLAVKKGVSRQPPSEVINAPHSSYWPFLLAVALAVLLIGFLTHPIVLGIGVILVAGAIIGWGLEKR